MKIFSFRRVPIVSYPNSRVLVIILPLILSASILLPEISFARSKYIYRQTKQVVAMLEDAVKEVELKGTKAFPQFRIKDSKWFKGEMYLFIYTMQGVNIFHPAQPELQGKDLSKMKDFNGKPLIQHLLKKAREGGGWVHYMWVRPGEFIPTWKSGYVKKAVMPDKTECMIGTGVYNISTEKQFIIDMVDEAITLIQEKGPAAFSTFRDTTSPFSCRESYIFIFKDDGTAVVDPAFPSLEGRNMLKYDVIRSMIEKMKNSDLAWVQYLRPKPGDVKPSKKLAYLRAVTLGKDRYIVGADFFPGKPIWMR